ncbi:hypothetical protein AHF37_12184 [Paragonimus kellicotti]|nr:hypothetical protein AHF37_12184 [Paragonimus kellicotti]
MRLVWHVRRKAVDDLEKSLEIQPNHANAKNYLGQTLVAYAGEISRKDPVKTEQLLHRALKLDPDNSEARDAFKRTARHKCDRGC